MKKLGISLLSLTTIPVSLISVVSCAEPVVNLSVEEVVQKMASEQYTRKSTVVASSLLTNSLTATNYASTLGITLPEVPKGYELSYKPSSAIADDDNGIINITVIVSKDNVVSEKNIVIKGYYKNADSVALQKLKNKWGGVTLAPADSESTHWQSAISIPVQFTEQIKNDFNMTFSGSFDASDLISINVTFKTLRSRYTTNDMSRAAITGEFTLSKGEKTLTFRTVQALSTDLFNTQSYIDGVKTKWGEMSIGQTSEAQWDTISTMTNFTSAEIEKYQLTFAGQMSLTDLSLPWSSSTKSISAKYTTSKQLSQTPGEPVAQLTFTIELSMNSTNPSNWVTTTFKTQITKTVSSVEIN